mgnify:CR=1 FL=1
MIIRHFHSLFIAIKFENFQLINLTEGWKEATCLRMEEVPVTQCDLDMMICEKLMRSKCRIPDIYSMKNRKLIIT